MKKKLIAGNWKMNPVSPSEADMLIDSMKKISNKNNNNEKTEMLLCVPSIFIERTCTALKNTSISIGAQNVYHEAKGAFTGEISIDMLLNYNIKYIIIGHSERREIFHESDQLINKKLIACIDKNIIPILCAGETEQQRNDNKTDSIITNQLDAALDGLKDKINKNNLVIAYEPIWAIGTGKTCSATEAQRVCQLIHKHVSSEIRVLYGGSVKGSNANELMGQDDIDGALVGGASLLADDFEKIVNF